MKVQNLNTTTEFSDEDCNESANGQDKNRTDPEVDARKITVFIQKYIFEKF